MAAKPSALDVTQWLERARDGDSDAREKLFRAVYDQLRELAARQVARERKGHTLQATSLVNELCLRFLQPCSLPGRNRVEFLAVAAAAMRNILINHAKARGRLKRGGGKSRVSLDKAAASIEEEDHGAELIALDEALRRLEAIDERKSRIVELRYFGGLSVDETAEALGVSPATVDRQWKLARLWLLRELEKDRA
jgi:RNA polymerase sigma factor (TIGR02999 family)